MAICVRVSSSETLDLWCKGLGEAVTSVCLRGVPASLYLMLFVGLRGEAFRVTGLCIAYVMNSAKDRKDSLAGCAVRTVLNASRNRSNVSE